MAAMLQTTFFMHSKKNNNILFQISLEFILKSPIDNKSVWVQLVAWLWTGDKQVSTWPDADPYLKLHMLSLGLNELTHWARVMHMCVSKLTTIGSDNGLSPGRRQAIIWTNAGILLIQTLGTIFSEILREIYTFSFKKMHLKMSSGKCRPSCLGLNVLSLLNGCESLLCAWCQSHWYHDTDGLQPQAENLSGFGVRSGNLARFGR